MNARVFMVLVFSSVFMGIWNSDQKAMHSAIARNKRLSKPVAVFPMPPVETVRRENLTPLKFSVPEPRPVRVAMRSSDHAGQSEPLIERNDEQTPVLHATEMPEVTLEPASDDVPATQNQNIDTESVPGEIAAEPVVQESTNVEPVIPELALSDSADGATSETETTEASSKDSPAGEVVATAETSGLTVSSSSVEPATESAATVADAESVVTRTEESDHGDTERTEVESEEVSAEVPVADVTANNVAISETPAEEAATQIEKDAVPAPEDFSVEATAAESVAENSEAETLVATESSAMLADASTEESDIENAAELSVENEQPIAELAEAELPAPAEPVIEDSAASSDAVAINEAEPTPADSKAADAGEEEKSFEEKLLKSGEYDMLDVHSEDVTPGTVEPALDGGATCIPLPRNLASGTWQVIHPSGEFFKITVDRGTSSPTNRDGVDSETLETSFCITAAPDGVRWCFIRSFVDSPAPVRRVTTEFFSPGQQ